MSRPEELLCNRCPQKENCDYIKLGRLSLCTANSYFCEGYIQASKDYIVYAQLWVDSGEVNIKSFKQFLKDRGYE